MELISKQAALKVISSYGGADATDPEGQTRRSGRVHIYRSRQHRDGCNQWRGLLK